jgi:hypothetical protein
MTYSIFYFVSFSIAHRINVEMFFINVVENVSFFSTGRETMISFLFSRSVSLNVPTCNVLHNNEKHPPLFFLSIKIREKKEEVGQYLMAKKTYDLFIRRYK